VLSNTGTVYDGQLLRSNKFSTLAFQNPSSPNSNSPRIHSLPATSSPPSSTKLTTTTNKFAYVGIGLTGPNQSKTGSFGIDNSFQIDTGTGEYSVLCDVSAGIGGALKCSATVGGQVYNQFFLADDFGQTDVVSGLATADSGTTAVTFLMAACP
jgi:hypothetical protein